jgi:shikimate kinase
MDASSAKLVLTGGMGAGKSTVGRACARALRAPFTDLDEAIAREAGRPIPAIFEELGEAAFRTLEARVGVAVLRAPECGVLALGGGAMMHPEIRDAIVDSGAELIWLDVSPDVAWARVRGDAGGRPLLQGPDPASQLRQLAEERAQWYALAHRRIVTDGRTVEEIVRETIHGGSHGR